MAEMMKIATIIFLGLMFSSLLLMLWRVIASIWRFRRAEEALVNTLVERGIRVATSSGSGRQGSSLNVIDVGDFVYSYERPSRLTDIMDSPGLNSIAADLDASLEPSQLNEIVDVLAQPSDKQRANYLARLGRLVEKKASKSSWSDPQSGQQGQPQFQ
jgi:hypothetical protein